SFDESNPTMSLPDTGDRWAAGTIVEDLHGIFQIAQLTGGNGRNIMVVGDSDGKITVAGQIVNVMSWTGTVTLDNGRNDGSDGKGALDELYIVNDNNTAGAKVNIRDTGQGSGRDEIV